VKKIPCDVQCVCMLCESPFYASSVLSSVGLRFRFHVDVVVVVVVVFQLSFSPFFLSFYLFFFFNFKISIIIKFINNYISKVNMGSHRTNSGSEP
jgi:hypothetical protein